MYTAMNKSGETIVRVDSQIAGQQFLVDEAEDCTIHVLDHCAQVTVDSAHNCEIVVGPCEDSLFVRDCENWCVRARPCRVLPPPLDHQSCTSDARLTPALCPPAARCTRSAGSCERGTASTASSSSTY